jgi:WD40 repeat protein
MRFACHVFSFGLAVCVVAFAAGFVRGQIDDPRWPSRIIPPDEREEKDELGRFKPPVVTAVCMQPGGPLLATTGDDHYIRVWNMEEGTLLVRLEGHADWVRTLAFSPDGKTLASAGNDRTIVLWHTETLQKIGQFAQHEAAITAIAFSPDGSRLAAVGFENMLKIYDAASGELVGQWECPCRDMRTLAYSPDGLQLAAAGRDGVIRVWNTADGRVLHDQRAHRQRVRALAWSPDGLQLVSCSEDRTVQIWNIGGDGSVAALPQRPAKVQSVAFVAAGKLAVGGSDNTIRLWDLTTKTELDKLEGHTGSIVALAHRDTRLVSGSYDTTVRVWTVDLAR